MPEHEHDFTLYNGGSVVLLQPFTPEAREWLDLNIGPEAQYLGDSLAVEARYVSDIIEGIINDGLTVEGE